ncbi:MAG: sigma-70 family RNA polymerase sigma factor [Planctomycetales bacterium]|nr:sigma-70 family RNA polymerase sigma factor [Planctomycetales bacterium]
MKRKTTQSLRGYSQILMGMIRCRGEMACLAGVLGMCNGEAQSFRKLIQEVREGSPEAFQQVIDQYGRHVYRAVRRRLDRRIRSKFDSDDFAQAVWVSLFDNRQQLNSFAEPAELIKFLAQIASNKVVDECRRRLRLQQHNVNRERQMDDPEHWSQDTANSPSPTPSAFAIAEEQMELLCRDQRKTHLQVLELRSRGATFAEIASQTGVPEKTIQRFLHRLSRRIVQ